MSQDPCRTQTPDGGTSQTSTSSSPRQTRIDEIREAIDQYDTDSIYTQDPPLPDPLPGDEDPSPPEDTGENLPPEARPLIEAGDSEIQATRLVAISTEGQKRDGESLYNFIFSTTSPEESLVFTNFNAPILKSQEAANIRSRLFEKFADQYFIEGHPHSDVLRASLGSYANSGLQKYSRRKNPLIPELTTVAGQKAIQGPRNSPGYNIDIDTFRYVTGKFFAAIDSETSARFKADVAPKEGIRMINTTDKTRLANFKYAFKYSGYQDRDFNQLNVHLYVLKPKDLVYGFGTHIGIVDGLRASNNESLSALELAVETKKEENYLEALKDFPAAEGSKLEKYVIKHFGNTVNPYDFDEERSQEDRDDANLNDIGYIAYMRSGWSWRNYFHGFYPLFANRYHSIKDWRDHFGSRENVLVRGLKDDGSAVFVHPNDRLAAITIGPNALRAGRTELSEDILTYPMERIINQGESIAPPFTYDRLIEQESSKNLPPYSTNMFPVIPFYGKHTLIPDEIRTLNDLVDKYWGEPFVRALMRSYNLHSWTDSNYEALRNILRRALRATGDLNEFEIANCFHPVSDNLSKDELFNYLGNPGVNKLERAALDLLPITSRYTRFATFEKRTFKDHVTSLPTFSTEYDLQTAKTRLSSYVYAKGEYNFFDPIYEGYIDGDNNFNQNYNTSVPRRSGAFRADRAVRNDVKFNLPKTLPDPYTYNPKSEEERTKNLEEGYAEHWYQIPPEEAQYSFFSTYNFLKHNQFKTNSIFGSTYIKSKEFKDIYVNRKMFPMYTDIEIGQSGKSLFLDLIDSVDGSEQILSTLASTQNKNTFSVVSANVLNTSENDQDVKIETGKQVSYITIDQWADTMSDYISSQSGAENYEEKLKNAFAFVSFKEKLSNYCKTKARNYQQILEGELAHSEIIGYKIDKYQLVNPQEAVENPFGAQSAFENRTYIKSYYFAGTNSDDPTKFIDTQVEYGHAYEYEIHSICLIVGTEYAYLDTQSARRDVVFNQVGAVKTPYGQELGALLENAVGSERLPGGIHHYLYGLWHEPDESLRDLSLHMNLHFSVISKPSPVIAETFVRRMTVGILDKPPIPPNVDIVPLKDSPNLVQFNITSMTGEVFAKPILLDYDDYDQYWISAMNQGLDPSEVLGARGTYWGEPPSETELLHFKNDDQCFKFEVFKVTGNKPSSWKDFAGTKIDAPRYGATSTTFIEQLVPNVKYYYAFRSTDVHGHTSLPGHIHEVEIRKEDGRQNFYLVQNTFRFEDIDKESRTKKASFRRFLQIKPSLLQTQIPDLIENQYSYEKWRVGGKKLGTSSNTLWGKTLLFRVRSKSTGKMVEIRVKFKRKHGIVDDEGNVRYDD